MKTQLPQIDQIRSHSPKHWFRDLVGVLEVVLGVLDGGVQIVQDGFGEGESQIADGARA